MLFHKSYESKSLKPTTLHLPDRYATKWAIKAIKDLSISYVIYTREIAFLPYYFVQVKISAITFEWWYYRPMETGIR